MKLEKARVQNYRSIRDTGWFDIEGNKTIFVGANEAGKTAVLRALQQISPPPSVQGFDALRDYPRALYQDIKLGKVDPARATVVEAVFKLDADDVKAIPVEFKDCSYHCGRHLDNSAWHKLVDAPSIPTISGLKGDLLRLSLIWSALSK